MKALAFVAIVVAHVLLVTLLMAPYREPVRETIDEPRMVLVSIQPRPGAGSELRDSAPLLPLQLWPSPLLTIEPPAIDISSAITVSPDTSAEEPARAPSVDWQQETRGAAARTAEALEAERQRKGKLAPDPRFARPAPGAPAFGWDQSRIHRIESLPEGGTIIHLNDRCVLALNGFILPMCRLGKIEARGDLFEHMGDSLDSSVP